MSSSKNSLEEQDSFIRRGKKRIRRVALTGVTTLVTRGSTIAASFISISLTATYLGSERFGLWLTLSTLLTWMNLADFGLANSLTNVIATAEGQKDLKQAKQAVSSAFWMMIGIAITLGTLFIITYPLISWSKFFNVTSNLAKVEAGIGILVGFFFFAVRLPLSITSKIYDAYQEGYFYQLWVGISGCLSLIALYFGTKFQVGLPALVGAYFGSYLIADLLSTFYLFIWRRPSLKPSFQSFNWSTSWSLMSIGIKFWILQISAIVLYQTDLIIVTQLFGSRAVASYGIIFKLFSVIGVIQNAFLVPLWPAYSEAFAIRDVEWILNTFKRSIKICLFWSISSGTILFYLSPWIINSWLGKEAVPRGDLMLTMLGISILNSIGQCLAFFMNGLGQVNSQVIFGMIAAITNLIVSVILGKLIGVTGVALGTFISFTITIFLVGIDAFKNIKLLQSID